MSVQVATPERVMALFAHTTVDAPIVLPAEYAAPSTGESTEETVDRMTMVDVASVVEELV